MKKWIGILAIALAGGCATVNKVDSGEQAIGERMAVHLEGAWNHLNFPGMGPAQTWTMEGLPVDQLLIFSGLKDGEAVHRESSASQKSFNFRSTMQPDEIVALFEGMLTRDGSQFKLAKLEPTAFGGGKGFRFEYSLIRKADNAVLTGVGYGTVNKGELFALLYLAPRLTFFERHKQRVEQIARSARIKG